MMVITVKPGIDDGYITGILFHFVSQGKKSVDFVSYSSFVNADKIDGTMKLGALMDIVQEYFKEDLQGQVIRGHIKGIDLPRAISSDDITDAIKEFMLKKESEVVNG
ncbi:hypothetical protein [Mucilaginibacter sp.]|uniref:hypothetical protein n=1 Tax=Mucilaginibacter sp. TaxID=1882438 RepID=UPI0035BBF7A8